MSSTTRARFSAARIAIATTAAMFLALGHAACDDAPAGVAGDATTGSDASDTQVATGTTTAGDATSTDTAPVGETTPDGVSITFVITVPDETPLGATLSVTRPGGTPIPLVQGTDGTYRATASIAAARSHAEPFAAGISLARPTSTSSAAAFSARIASSSAWSHG